MGGQACILYGGAEFSRDADLCLLADDANFQRLKYALSDLGAVTIAVPPFGLDYLLRGHACHFRCLNADSFNLRIDVMSVMRGVSAFADLWERRTTVDLIDGHVIEVLGLPDLVQAKKTQRDKDWPMIRRLVESNVVAHVSDPTTTRVAFWLKELRTPELLRQICQSFPAEAEHAAQSRRVLLSTIEGQSDDDIQRELLEEEMAERLADKQYWEPLKRELETLRHAKS